MKRIIIENPDDFYAWAITTKWFKDITSGTTLSDEKIKFFSEYCFELHRMGKNEKQYTIVCYIVTNYNENYIEKIEKYYKEPSSRIKRKILLNKLNCTREEKFKKDINSLWYKKIILDNLLTEYKNDFLKKKFSEIDDMDISGTSKLRKKQVCCKIVINHEEDFEDIYCNYFNTTNPWTKQQILYGDERLKEIKQTFREHAKRLLKSGDIHVSSKAAFFNKGGTEEEWENRIQEAAIKCKNTKKQNIAAGKKYKNRRNTYVYWIELGYTREEAKEILDEEFFSSKYVVPTLTSYIARYGEEEGIAKFNKLNTKRIQTKIEKYGTVFQTSYTSKESISKLSPIKELIKSSFDIDESRIYGLVSKEYFLKDKKQNVFFYDLTFLDLKIIIEYNGSFWHINPNLQNSRLAPWLDRDITLWKDEHKKTLAEDNGFTYYVIWDTDNIQLKMEEILNECSLRFRNNDILTTHGSIDTLSYQTIQSIDGFI